MEVLYSLCFGICVGILQVLVVVELENLGENAAKYLILFWTFVSTFVFSLYRLNLD